MTSFIPMNMTGLTTWYTFLLGRYFGNVSSFVCLTKQNSPLSLGIKICRSAVSSGSDIDKPKIKRSSEKLRAKKSQALEADAPTCKIARYVWGRTFDGSGTCHCLQKWVEFGGRSRSDEEEWGQEGRCGQDCRKCVVMIKMMMMITETESYNHCAFTLVYCEVQNPMNLSLKNKRTLCKLVTWLMTN